MTGKRIVDFIRRLHEEKGQNNTQLTPEQQEKYDQHYDRLSDRGGMTHEQIHRAVLAKMGIKPKPKPK